mmetsp:Transcript_11764/g.15349  ORF Transcript_11764/g.15349 Transcript_11764/m.15349 type:complete len:593 (-) Transcript_11764:206-1984(-)
MIAAGALLSQLLQLSFYFYAIPIFLAFIFFCLKVLWGKAYNALATGKAELKNDNTSVVHRAIKPKCTSSQLGFKEGEDLVSLLQEQWPGINHLTFCPAWWLPTGLVQTWYSGRVQHKLQPRVEYDRELVRMADGGVVRLDWVKASWRTWDKYALIIPGLTSSSSEIYIRNACIALGQVGWRAVVMNNRGCGNSPTLTPHGYSASMTDDIRYIVQYVKEKIGEDSLLMGVGFSLGANILVKYLGEEGERAPLVAAASVGNPWDFMAVSRNIPTFISSVLSKGLKEIFRTGLQRFFTDHSDICIEDVMASTTVAEYDETMVRRHFGYMTTGDYYRDASSVAYLHKVRTPLLGINATDDPICHYSGLPYDEMAANPYTAFIVTRKGGHLGWWANSRDPNGGPQQWVNGVIAQYADAVLSLRRKDHKLFQDTEGTKSKITANEEEQICSTQHSTEETPLEAATSSVTTQLQNDRLEQRIVPPTGCPFHSQQIDITQQLSFHKHSGSKSITHGQSKHVVKVGKSVSLTYFVSQLFEILKSKYLSRWTGKLSILILLSFTVSSLSIQRRRLWLAILLSGYSLLSKKNNGSKKIQSPSN